MVSLWIFAFVYMDGTVVSSWIFDVCVLGWDIYELMDL